MTRWARNKTAQKHSKLPSDSTPWLELKVPFTKDMKLKQNTEKRKLHQKRSKSLLENESSRTKMSKVCKHNRINSFIVTPLHSHEILTSDKKKVKPVLKNTKYPNSKTFNGKNQSEKPSSTEKEKLEKKDKYREKMIKKRNDRGIQLLSQKVERKIYNMKRGMRKKGMSGDEIKAAVRKFRRREELLLRKDSGRICLRCRKPGHKVAECQEILDDNEQSMGVCFKCGSTEHILSQCNAPAEKDGVLPFAKCFVCGELGHLSNGCSKNPRGKYPKGGACKICSSVNHLASQCPQDEKMLEDEPTVSLIVHGTSVDMDSFEDSKPIKEKPRKTVICF